MFKKYGKIKRCGIHWDKAGISKGEADVEYFEKGAGERAVEDLNGNLDYLS